MNSFDIVMTRINVAEEGYNMNTAKIIRGPKVKKMRQCLKVAIKAYRLKLFDESSKYFALSYKLCYQVKKDVANAREPENAGEKILSYLTPVFSTLPSKRDEGWAYVTYSDPMSTSTTSGVKQNIQERLNLFIKTLEDYEKIAKRKQKKNEKNPISAEKLKLNKAKFEAYRKKVLKDDDKE